MDAPLYRPSPAYEPPVLVPEVMNTTTTSIARLMADPAAKAIMVREVPNILARINNEGLRPHLDNFSARSLVQFGMFKAEDLDRVDVQLKALRPAAGAAK